MQKHIQLAGFAAVVLWGAAAVDARQVEAPPDVTVWLHTTVITAPGSIEHAKQVAREMFASIGVNVAWRNEITAREPGVLIKVVVQSGPQGENVALGEALPFALGHGIIVNYDEVLWSAGTSKQLEPMILAHVLVHEITHILQVVDRHSDRGIMKAHWTPDDYCDMRWKPLEFTTEDVELIRLGMRVLKSRAEAAH